MGTKTKPIEWISGLKLYDVRLNKTEVAFMVQDALYGRNLTEIASLVGLSFGTIHDIKWGRHQAMKPRTIYAVYEYLDKLPPSPSVRLAAGGDE